MKYRFMKKYSQEHCISKMARVLKVSRSGYYKWIYSVESERSKDNAALIGLISKYQTEFYYAYGSKRMAEHIKKEEKIATVGEKLGAEIHSSVDGVVVEINQNAIVVERQEIS